MLARDGIAVVIALRVAVVIALGVAVVIALGTSYLAIRIRDLPHDVQTAARDPRWSFAERSANWPVQWRDKQPC